MAVTEHWLKKSFKGQGSQGEMWCFGYEYNNSMKVHVCEK